MSPPLPHLINVMLSLNICKPEHALGHTGANYNYECPCDTPPHPVNDSVILDIQLLISYCKLHALLIRLRVALSLLAMVFLLYFYLQTPYRLARSSRNATFEVFQFGVSTRNR